MRILEGFSATVFCSETLGRPQKCYSWIWHFLAFDDSWPSTKVGGLRRRRGKRNFAAELLGLPSSTNEGNLCEKRKRELGDIGSFTSTTTQRFFYLISVVLTVLIESKRQGGQIVSKEILFEFYYFPWDNFHLVFRYSPRSSSSLILVRPRNSLFIYDSG